MDGGTFTISNGGVFGSLFGTPIINPPQSAILGMHAIFDRPVAVGGKVGAPPSCTGGFSEQRGGLSGTRTIAHMLSLGDWCHLLKGFTVKEEPRLMGVGQLCWHWYLPEVCSRPCPIREGENWIICLGVGRRL